MEGYFCETCEDAVKKALELMPEGSVVSWGGSMSISECGLMDALKEHNYTLIDLRLCRNGTGKEGNLCQNRYGGLLSYEYQCHCHGRRTGQH